jgi:hypothetical protein
MTEQMDQPRLPFRDREEPEAALSRLRQRVRQRELDDARAQGREVTVELDTGELRLLSEISPEQEHQVVAIRDDAWPYEPPDDEDLDAAFRSPAGAADFDEIQREHDLD